MILPRLLFKGTLYPSPVLLLSRPWICTPLAPPFARFISFCEGIMFRLPSSARRSTRLCVEPLEDRSTPSTAYLARDLISDQAGVAPVTDPTLVNAWGIAMNTTNGAFWVSANGADLSEVYTGDVNNSPIMQPFKVAIPGGAPT